MKKIDICTGCRGSFPVDEMKRVGLGLRCVPCAEAFAAEYRAALKDEGRKPFDPASIAPPVPSEPQPDFTDEEVDMIRAARGLPPINTRFRSPYPRKGRPTKRPTGDEFGPI